MKAYKLVRVRVGPVRLCSIGGDLAHATEYKPDVVATPRLGWGPLAAFRTVAAATKFMLMQSIDWDCVELWSADVIKALPCEDKLYRLTSYNNEKAYSIWDLPEGTILCVGICLRKRIHVKL